MHYILERYDRGSVGDVIVNPLGALDRHTDAACRNVLAKAAVLDVKRALVVLDRVEQVRSVPRDPPVTGVAVAVTKRIAASANGEHALNGGAARCTAGDSPFALTTPAAL